MGGGRRGGGRGAPGRRAPRQRPAPRWQLAGPWAVARSAPRPPPPRDEDEMRGGALASSSTDHGEGRTGAWRLEVWSSRGLGMGRPAVLGALGGGAAGERERDRGRRRWPAAMASTPRSLTPERIRTDPAATARESARGGRNRAPRHVRRRVPQPPCPGPARRPLAWSCPPAAPLVLPAGRSPLAATPPHARGPPRRGRSAPPRRHGGEREGCAPWPPAAASQPLCGWW